MTKTDSDNSERLFAYGTLQQASVQVDTFGRELETAPDTLVGYRLQTIRIQDEDFVALSGTAHHRTLVLTGNASDVVAGTVLALTRAELEQADEYEPEGYERIPVKLRSGLSAWVYLATDH